MEQFNDIRALHQNLNPCDTPVYMLGRAVGRIDPIPPDERWET